MRFLVSFCLIVGLLPGIRPQATAQRLTGAPVEISLQPEWLTSPTPGIYVEQVLDGRAVPEPLGLVVRGLNSTLREVQLQQGVAPELTALLHKCLPRAAETRPILLRIVSINVAEAQAGTFSTSVAAEMVADWYARQPDSTYYLLCRTYHTTRHNGGADLARIHAANLAALLEAGLARLDRVDWPAQQAAGPHYQLAQLRQRLPAQPYPIQSGAPLRPGVYSSFFEFRQNSPGRPGQVLAEARNYRSAEWQGLRAVEPFLLTPEGQRVAVEDAWGFCDGQQLYIRFGPDYYLLEQRGSAYVFSAPAQRNANSTLLFNGGPPKVPFSLHLLSGLIAEYAGPTGVASVQQVGRPTHLMVYRRRAAQAVTVPVLLNGKTVGQLPPNDFLSVPWQDTGQPVHLCVGSETCLELQPSFTEANYIEYQPDAAVRLRQVPVREGAAQVNRMAGR